jgi:hypothetical protein
MRDTMNLLLSYHGRRAFNKYRIAKDNLKQ